MIAPKNIPRETLIDLYLNQKLSTDAISKILNCRSHVTVLNYLKRYGVHRRSRLGNRKSISISKEVLFDLYHTKKISQKRIAQKFGHSLYGIQRKMKEYGIKSRDYSTANTKYPKYNFNGDLRERAYLIGFRLGDLNIYKVRGLIQSRCSTTIKEQVDLMYDLFKNYGNVHVWKAKRGTFEIIVLLNSSFDFLLPKKDLIEDWILKDDGYFISFLAGYADAEGSYFIRKAYYKTRKPSWGVFEIQTYDENIVQTIFKKLAELSIDSTLYVNSNHTQYKQNMYRITVVKKQNLWNFIKLMEPYHRHGGKLRDLKKVKDNLIMRNSIPYCRPITL